MPENPSRIFEVDKMKTNVRRLGYLCVFLFARPNWTSLVVGSALVLLAVLLHGWAAGYLARAGYENRETKLTLRGPYRHTRNPYYVAHLVMDFGFFLAAGLHLYYLVYFPFIYIVYRKWVLDEENFLQQEFGETYRKMKEKVPRWLIRIFPAEPKGHEEKFTWSDYIYNNELKRTLSHLCLIGLLWDFYYLKNPFLELSFLTQITIIGFVCTWVLLRDVEPYGFRKGRFLPIAMAFVSMALGLLIVPAWGFSPFRWTIARTTGFALGGFILLVLAGGIIPPVRRALGDFYDTTFKDPLLYVLYVFLGAALFLGNNYALWTGNLVCYSLWLFELGGLRAESFLSPGKSAN